MSQPNSSRVARRPSRGPVIVLVVGAALAVGLVLLGGELAAAPASAPADATPGTADRPRDVNVILHDYSFQPTPLYLFAGETVRLNVINGGLIQHELVLGGAAVQQAWASADAAATPPAPFATAPAASVPPEIGGVRVLLGSGQSTSVIYRVPAAGEPLQLVCHLPGHVEEGMIGKVELVTR